MRRVLLPALAALLLLGASLLAAPRAAEANHWAICQLNNSGPLLFVPVAALSFVSAAVTAGGGSIACISSNCFHPGSLPPSPFRPNC
jgi:hypothetical protein